MMKKVLLFGRSGKLGSAIWEVFSKNYNIVGLNSKDCDVSDFRKVKQLIKKIKPEIVINATNYGSAKLCEKNPEEAFFINSIFPRFLAQLSNIEKFLLIHFSSDAVFSGYKKIFFTELDKAFPKNIYGATKYIGDCFVQNYAKRYYILRMSILFGKSAKKRQFIDKAISKMMQKKLINIYGDFVFSPTYTLDVALKLKELIEKKFPFGLYHIANSGRASLVEFLEEVKKNLNLNATIRKISSDYLNEDSAKPCVLRSIKLKPLRNWKVALKEYCQNIIKTKNL